jgi:hypothetical protein
MAIYNATIWNKKFCFIEQEHIFQTLPRAENNGTARFKKCKRKCKCLNANIYSYLVTSGGHSSNPYLNVVTFFNTRVN